MSHVRVALALVLAVALAGPLRAEVTQRKVELRAPDGVALAATYWSPGRPGPGILLLHQCNSDRTSWADLAARLAGRGFHVLALDYRGYGESGGVREKDAAAQQRIVREKWPGDVDTAFDFLLTQPGVKHEPAGAGGASCGVHQAIQLARRHAEVRTLVLLSGNTDRSGEDFLDTHPGLPLLGSAAGDDDGAVAVMRWLLGFSRNPGNRLLEYATGGHGTKMFAVNADLEPAIVDWFEEHLVKHPLAVAPSAVPGGSASAKLRDQIAAPGAAAHLRAELAAARTPAERPQLPPEGVVNLLGYLRLQDGDTRSAVELFELNAAAHPDSVNAHDSLADGYLAAGDRERARAETEKALATLPRDPGRDTELQKAIREASEARLRQLSEK